MRLPGITPRDDLAAWRARAGVSAHAIDLLAASDVIDAHLDLDVPVRLFGYDPAVRHPTPPRPPRLWGHTDFPRLREGGFTGACYDIATNIARPARNRLDVTLANVAAAAARIEAWPDDLALVTDVAGYRDARRRGRVALWITLQGANAIAADPGVLDGPLGQRLHRVTLVHLTSSGFGATNSPQGLNGPITEAGRDLVGRLARNRVLVDLSHASPATFWGALDAHPVDVPPIVSHTGVSAVQPHWRNLDDAQLRALADRGGVIGVLLQSAFLEPVPMFGYGRRARFLDHLEHICRVVGDAFACIGTDYDGAITPPEDLPDVTAFPTLVQDMLDRGWSDRRIVGILGANYLRVVEAVRPGRAGPPVP